MTRKDPDLEKPIPANLLPPPDSNPSRPAGHDAILDLLAAEQPETLSAPPSIASDALGNLSDVLTSAEPPAIFRPGNTGIMSPDPTFPGIAPTNIPSRLRSPRQATPSLQSAGGPTPFVPPLISGADNPAAPLSSLPTLAPALGAAQPFLLPPDESPSAAAALSATSNPSSSSPGPSVPNSVRDILPLLPDAAPSSSADPPHVATGAAPGSTGNGNLADVAARRLPEITVSLGERHRMAGRVLATKDHKIEAIARELCKSEVHRSFSLLRADMRANFR